MSGEGTLFFNNGELYNGNWKENMKNGYGHFFYRSGQHYEGE